jgi:hypothetical protein
VVATGNHAKKPDWFRDRKRLLAYQQTVRKKIDPALVEWSGAGVFNARVFPLLPRTKCIGLSSAMTSI